MPDFMVRVRVAPTDCWSCGAETKIVSSVELDDGSDRAECSVADFTEFPHLVSAVEASLPSGTGVGALKRRFSRTIGSSYVSNGCFHCDALQGQHYEIHARYEEATMSEFHVASSEGWDKMLKELVESEDGHLFRG